MKYRILLKNKNEYITNIKRYPNGIMIDRTHGKKFVLFADIEKMRLSNPGEDFNNTPFYDEHESEFWRSHIITKDGIKERQ